MQNESKENSFLYQASYVVENQKLTGGDTALELPNDPHQHTSHVNFIVLIQL